MQEYIGVLYNYTVNITDFMNMLACLSCIWFIDVLICSVLIVISAVGLIKKCKFLLKSSK